MPTPRTSNTVPIATYRLQLSPSFTLNDTAAQVPYLAKLGISHLYLSPLFAAAPGSEHGYDVVDHNHVNEELGGIAALYALERAVAEHAMQLVLDIVPNHVGLAGGANPWWRDVMRYGRDSQYAAYFDIDWEGQAYLPAETLVYPILGRPFGEALESCELTLAWDDGELVVRYFDHTFPVAPKTYPLVIGLPPASLETADPTAPGQLAEVLAALERATADGCPSLLERFRALLTAEPSLRAFVDDEAAGCNGTSGDPTSFDHLERVLRAQPYRLAFWRVSAEEINYRRFFDVNDLAAIRVEYQPVFDEAHRLTRELAEREMLAGLRVDHIDGLYDPQAYLEQLDEVLNGEAKASGAPHRPIYVEKILGWNEQLPDHWRTDGTTGYEALARFDRVFIDPRGEQPLTEIYREFTGRRESFDDIAFATRRRIAERSFAGEINVLAAHLHRLAQANRLTRDMTLRAHRDAIAALLACLPVYRTYLEDGAPRTIDDETIARASAEASERDPNANEDALAFLAEVLLVHDVDGRPEEREQRLHFRRRLQQLSGPVMAKGVEDTAFYRYNRLLSLNEVGSNPGQFTASMEDLHAWFAERANRWPHALSATTTHDTKRSEDARARLHVLSELPREWRREVRAWARLNQRFRVMQSGRSVPGPNLEYYYYQTLIAAWDGAPTTTFRQRICDHLIKAMRESKEATAWTRVNAEFEDAVLAFARATLDGRRSRRFIDRVQRFVDRIQPAATSNSLAMLTLKATTPGVPDFYQGSELFLNTLTDPDNRRPVDFAARAQLLAGTEPWWWAAGADGPRMKLQLMQALLSLRARHPAVFAEGEYIPLEVVGELRERVFAFARRHRAQWILVVVPRLVATLAGADGRLSSAAWGDTRILLNAELAAMTWRNALDGRDVVGGTELLVSGMLSETPVGVFEGSAP